MVEAVHTSETSFLTRSTRRHIPEDNILEGNGLIGNLCSFFVNMFNVSVFLFVLVDDDDDCDVVVAAVEPTSRTFTRPTPIHVTVVYSRHAARGTKFRSYAQERCNIVQLVRGTSKHKR
jgi:hypothetical protein